MLRPWFGSGADVRGANIPRAVDYTSPDDCQPTDALYGIVVSRGQPVISAFLNNI